VKAPEKPTKKSDVKSKIAVLAICLLACIIAFGIFREGSPDTTTMDSTNIVNAIWAEPVLNEGQIVSIEFIRSGGFAGGTSGWIVTTTEMSERGSPYHVEIIEVEKIPGDQIIDEVKKIVKLDNTKARRKWHVADAYQYKFKITFADGTRIDSWFEMLHKESEAEPFIKAGDEIKKKLSANTNPSSSNPESNQ
jgi:hypothetical protein